MANINALKSQAAKLVVKGDYAKALTIYEKVKEMDSDEPGTYNLIGDVYLKMSQKESAITEFNQALELYKKVQYYPNAIAVCKKIIRTDKNQIEVYNDLADLYVERGFIGEAVINYLEYASRMRQDGNKKKEIETYKKVIELGPTKIDIRESLVDLYIAEGEKEAAIEELEKIEELLIQQGKQAKLPAIEEKLAALQVDEMSAPTETEVLEEEKEEGEKEEAKEEAKEGATITQGFTMEDMIGEGLKTEEKIEEIEEGKEKIEEISHEDVISLEDEIAKLEGITAIAETEPVTVENLPPPHETELQSAPTQWTNFEELAELCLSVNSKNEAVDYFYKAGQVYLGENNYEKAINIFKRIIEVKPLELRPRQKLIEISLKRGEKEGAAEGNLDLGKCLYKKGALEEAEKAFKRALEISSKKEKINKSIEKIKRGEKEVEEEVKKVETPSISLGELLEEEQKTGVKFSVAEETEVEEPVTFEDLLEEFKEGVLENIEDEDFNSHYDLGITYKEMGLLEEAILEFQKASKGEKIKLKSIELLADCLVEKGDLHGAETMIKEAFSLEGHKDIEFLGLKYHLAQIYEHTNKNNEATQLFIEILKVDSSFKEAAVKLKELNERIKRQRVVSEKKVVVEKEKEVKKVKKEVKEKKEVEEKKVKPREKVKAKRKKKISYI
ncbi:MAG: tetratricopeptide repeat protein [Candidatus Cloacimonadota bacterium]|nr:MAG: tetratricopeptide repeat protein [Candidatus Cloacimonadota bacterium]